MEYVLVQTNLFHTSTHFVHAEPSSGGMSNISDMSVMAGVRLHPHTVH